MERQDRQAKTFDPTVCFMFFGNWMDSISILETEADRNSPAYMLFKAIADYSMYRKEPDFSQPVNRAIQLLWPILSQQIDESIKNRKRGFGNDGITPTQEKILDAYKKNPRASMREIARQAEVSTNTVNRTRHLFADEIQRLIDSVGGGNSVDRDRDGFKDIDISVDRGKDGFRDRDIDRDVVNDSVASLQNRYSRNGTTHSVSGDDVQQEDQFADLTDDDGELPF